MKTHDLIQGSPEWHAYRANHFNASEAPAMMGLSPYQTRTELLHAHFTGMAKDVDASTQSLFDAGHRFEALARPLAEKIISEDLYPVTGSEGKLSASFDGLTMDESICFEHKSLNASIKSAQTVEDLGPHLHIQMEQQLMISGAKKCLFMASKWDDQDQLIEEKHFWYESDQALRTSIVQGWCQFAEDLASYVPKELAEKPQADAIMQLPALSIQIKGEVTLSNLPDFKAKAEQYIASIKTDLQTDNDFANAEETIKFCDKAEKSLGLSKAAAISQTASIDELMRTIDNIAEQLRSKRLSLTKLVSTKKEQIKLQILNDVKQAFADHAAKLEAEITPIKLNLTMPDFSGAMKNKRTLVSLHDAVDTLLASSKSDANEIARKVRTNFFWFGSYAKGYEFLFSNLQQIIFKDGDDFELAVSAKVADHKAAEAAKLEAERARIQLEEEAKAKAAQDKINAESEAQRVAAAKLESDRLALEQKQAEVKPEVANVIEVVMATPVAHPFPTRTAVLTDTPTLTLGKIGTRLGFSLTADFLRSIGFEPAGRERAAMLYHESDWQAICAALVARIDIARNPQQQAA